MTILKTNSPAPIQLRRPRTHRVSISYFAAGAIVYLAVVYFLPILRMLLSSVSSPTVGIHNFQKVLTTQGYWRVISNTFWIGGAATVIAGIIGYLLAYIGAHTDRKAIRLVIIVALIGSQLSSVLTRSFAWMILLGGNGLFTRIAEATLGTDGNSLLFSQGATLIGLVQFLLPFTALPLMTVMQRMDTRLELTAYSLGAGRLTTFARIFFPLVFPGVAVAIIMVFVYAIGAFATPAILGGQKGVMIGVVIERTLITVRDTGLASALSVVLVIVVAIAGYVSKLTFGSFLGVGSTPTTVYADDRTGESPRHATKLASIREGSADIGWSIIRAMDRVLTHLRRPMLACTTVLAVLLLLGPQIIAAQISFTNSQSLLYPPPGYSLRWYRQFFTADWIIPSITSVVLAVCASCVALIIGVLGAAAATTAPGIRLKVLITVTMGLPVVIPTVVSANAFFVSFLPLGLTDSFLGLLIAHSCILTPFTYGIVLANLSVVDRAYIRTAASLGAGSIRTLLTVQLPMIRTGLWTAFGLAWIVSFDEAVIGIFLSGLYTTTLPARMYEAITMDSNPTVGVPGALMLAASLAVLIVVATARGVRRVYTHSQQKRVTHTRSISPDQQRCAPGSPLENGESAMQTHARMANADE